MHVKRTCLLLSLFLAASCRLSIGAEADCAFLVPFQDDIAHLKKASPPLGQALETGSREFHRFRMGSCTALAVVPKAGLQESTVATDIAILKLGARRVISLGMAGSLDDAHKPGDIVFVRSVACHERGSHGEEGRFVPAPGAAEKPQGDPFLDRFQACMTALAESNGVRVSQAVLASGNSFIANELKRREIAVQCGAELVDMNAAGIIESCRSFGKPLCIVRIVSDRANETARADFDAFIKDRSRMNQFLDLAVQALQTACEDKP